MSADSDARSPGWRVRGLVALIGGVCFLSSLPNGFVYDDVPIIRDNPRVTDWTDFKAIWLTDWWQPYGEMARAPDPRRDRLYRPLSVFTFSLNHAVGGLNPLGYHVANVLLHMAACALLWTFIWRLFGQSGLATIAGLLFAVHPIHCEAVANIVGRAEVLAAAFLLGGLTALLPGHGIPGPRRWAIAAACFLAAVLSKETAISYPALAAIVVATRFGVPGVRAGGSDRPTPRGAGGRQAAIAALALLAPLAVYFPLRFIALESRLIRDTPTSTLFNPYIDTPLQERVVGVFTILGHYTRLLAAPAKLSSDYGLAITDPRNEPVGMTVLGMAAAAAWVAMLAGYFSRHQTWQRLAVCAAMFLASYALISNSLILIGVSLAERLFYWPSAPALLALAVGVDWFWRNSVLRRPAPGRVRLFKIAGLAMLAVLGLRATVRNIDWSSNEILFEADSAAWPQGSHLQAAIGRELYNRAMTSDEAERPALLVRAEQHFNRALEIHRRFPSVLAVRGLTRFYLGDAEAAERDLASSVLLDPADYEARMALALVRGLEKAGTRLEELQRQAASAPGDPDLRVALGRQLLEIGRTFDAQAEFEAALAISPDHLDAKRLLGQVLALHRKVEQAIELWREVVEQDPNDWETRVNLSAMLASGDPAACLHFAQEAHRLEPTVLQTNQNLAEALAVNGRIDEALRQYRRVEQGLKPGDPLLLAVQERIRELQDR